MNKRKDTASKVIKASPTAIYNAFLDPKAVASWRPPEGMKCKIFKFDPKEGGTYRMSYEYVEVKHDVAGKTSQDADVFKGRFLELVPDKRIVEIVEFDSDDPAFAGSMSVTTSFTAVPGGTEVAFLCENVPDGIKADDHQKGMISSLDNLAKFVE